MPSSGLPFTVEPVPVGHYPRTAQSNDCAQRMAQKGLNNLLGHGFHGTTVVSRARVQISGTMNRPYRWLEGGVSFNQVSSQQETED